ncbi:MAG: prolipoprotein diacylglyceryl transferase [Oceanipulchritudo sp.]
MLAYWVHDLEPVIYQITEKLAVRWYGLSYVTGFLIAFALLGLYWKRGRSVLDPRMQENLAVALILGVLIGGRVGYFLLYETVNLLRDPLVLFRVWEGGMASHGGFAGVAVAILWISRKNRLPSLKLGDLIASVAPPGLLLGRIANFVNGELWGKVSQVPWAVIFPKSAPAGTPVSLISPRHPSQLYEAVLEGLVLLLYMQYRFWRVKGRKEATLAAADPPARPGHLTGEFLVVYSLARCIGEVFREPDASLILGLNRGIFYSILLLLVGLALIAWIRVQPLTNRKRA